MYGRKSHKSVMIAAHAVVNLIRTVYPALLKTKDRGKFHVAGSVPAAFGQTVASSGVDGVELLEMVESGEIIVGSDDEIYWKEDQDSVGEGGEDEGWGEVSGDEGEDEEEEDGDEAPDLVAVDGEEGEGEDGWEEVSEGEEGDDEEEGEEGWEEVSQGGEEGEEEEEEEGEEGEWEYMSGEEGDVGGKRKRTSDEEAPEEQAPEKIGRLDSTRLLTQEDFELIRKLKDAMRERERDPKYVTRLICSCLEDYCSILLLSYSISSGALGSSHVLILESILTLALHNTIILIITHLSTLINQ